MNIKARYTYHSSTTIPQFCIQTNLVLTEQIYMCYIVYYVNIKERKTPTLIVQAHNFPYRIYFAERTDIYMNYIVCYVNIKGRDTPTVVIQAHHFAYRPIYS